MPATSRINVLLVDDRPENLVALHAALQHSGYSLVDALSGSQALREAEQSDFAVILLDVQMPGMDGFETARRLRRLPRHRNTPIIFVTAISRSEAYELEGYGAGAVDYLFKPINVDILRAKLEVFASLQRQREEIARQAELLRARAVEDREKELLRDALKARDEFLAMASHELKTPITPLNLQLETFLDLFKNGRFHETDPARLRRMLEIAYTQVGRLSRTIDELLDVSRISTGRLQLSFERIDITELVKNLVDSFASELAMAKCDLHLESEGGLYVQADRFRLEQVFINLLTNAMRYAPGQPVHLKVRPLGDRVCITVKDHGAGIALQDQARIFQRFERATSSRHHGGLGLGLYIADQIVNMHGGRLYLESKPGEGASFHVELKRSAAGQQPQQSA